MHGAIPPLPHRYSWHCAQLRTGTSLYMLEHPDTAQHRPVLVCGVVWCAVCCCVSGVRCCIWCVCCVRVLCMLCTLRFVYVLCTCCVWVCYVLCMHGVLCVVCVRSMQAAYAHRSPCYSDPNLISSLYSSYFSLFISFFAFISPFIYLSVNLFVYTSVSFSVCLFIHPFHHYSVQPIHRHIRHRFRHPSTHLPVCMLYPWMSLS
jgi:hypothetical protein